MEVFIAPAANAVKTVDAKLARTLLKSHQAFVERDGRISVGSGYITCELPKLNATETAIARKWSNVWGCIQTRSQQIQVARAKAELDDSHLIVQELETIHERLYNNHTAIMELVDYISDDPLKIAAIRTAASLHY